MNNHAEEAVLGCFLLDRDAYAKVRHQLEPGDFFDERCKMVYRAIQAVGNEGLPIDIVTVSEEMDHNGTLENVGGPEYLAHLQNYVPVTTHLHQYTQIIRHNSALFRMSRFAEEVKELAENKEMKVADRLEAVKEKLQTIYERSFYKPKPDMIQLHDEWVRDEALDKIKTGVDFLDKCTGGIRRGKLWLFPAPSGMGKTTFCLQMMTHILDLNYKVNFYSVEFDNSDMYRYLNRVTDEFTTRDKDRAHYKWQLNFSRERDWKKIQADIIADKPDVVFIDYVQALNLGQGKELERLSDFASQAMEFTRNSGIAIVLVSQVSREAASKGSVDPMGASALKNNCDVLFGLVGDREKEDESKTNQVGFPNTFERVLKIGKNRYGPEGAIPIKFDYQPGKGYYLINER